MQDKIIVTPSEVRGLGNIVSEKELEDFLVYMSTITSSSEEVDGITRKVYALGYVPPQVSLTLTLEKTVLDYDEHTNLIATLLDENNVGIPNEEVKFYNENSYLFYTGTTDSNGVITINNVYSHQPGQHTYTGVLTSDTDITGSVTVTINKITSTLSLATSSAAVNVGGSFTLSGTLNAGSGKSVKIYQNGTLIDTVTTGTNGAYSKSITASAEGSFTYYAVFDGDSVYSDVTSSSVSVTVSAAPVPVPASIVLTSDKQILSYADQDSCTLSATVRDENDVLMEGVTVTFKVDGTSIGTAVTGSNGIATKTYDSQGVGDITCTAEIGMIVSEIFVVHDYLKYDDATTDKSNKFSFIANPTSSSISHQTDHYAISYSRTPESNPVKIKLVDFDCGDFEASIDVLYTSDTAKQWTWKVCPNPTFAYDNMSEIGSWTSSRILRTFENSTSHGTNPSGELPKNTWLTFKFKRENGNISLKAYNGSTLMNEYSSVGWTATSDIIMGWQMSEKINSFHFKNIIVKPL